MPVAWRWAASTGPTKVSWGLPPPSWSVFLIAWSETCTWIDCQRSLCKHCSCSLKGANAGLAAWLMSYYGPAQFCLYKGLSVGISSTFLTLCWEMNFLVTAPTDVPWARLPVQLEWTTCKTIPCGVYWLVAAFPVHPLSLSYTSKQVNWIHNCLWFLTAETDIPEV